MTKEEVCEQIQNDLICYLDGLSSEVIDNICQIVINNINKLED